MHRTSMNDARPLRFAIACTLGIAAGCGAISREPRNDSQAHWLKPCDDDAACGELQCLCGVCSLPCVQADDCPTAPGSTMSCTPSPALTECADLAQDEGRCEPTCHGEACPSPPVTIPGTPGAGDAAGTTVVHAHGSNVPPAAEDVPVCPEVAPTTGLPPYFARTEMGDYEGIATVNQITADRTVVLVPNEVVGHSVELQFNVRTPAFLPLGQRVRLEVMRERPGPDAAYTLIIVRDEAGGLLLAMHTGTDHLYQAGLFASRDAIGATLTLTMLCQSRGIQFCFINQTESEYTGTFVADTTVAFDSPTIGELSIDGVAYHMNFSASSVDGDGILPGGDCRDDAKPHRGINFHLLRK